MPCQKYHVPEALELTSSESESEDEDLPRYVEAHRNQGAVVFSDSLLRGAESALRAEQAIKEVSIHGGAKVDQVLDNARAYLDDNPGSFLVIICAGSNDLFERWDYSISPAYDLTKH